MAVTAPYVSPEGHSPAAVRLYVPKSWTSPPERPKEVGVPEGWRRGRTKGRIAPDLLDEVRDEELLPGDVVITDAGSGVSPPFRAGLERRQLFPIAGVTATMVVFIAEPRRVWPVPSTRGRPRSTPPLADESPRPVGLKSRADRLPRGKVTWREGTKGKPAAKFARVRVGPAQDWGRGGCAGAEALRLLIEERADGTIRSASSDLPARASRIKAVGPWKSRWPVEHGYQEMKEELGLNHFEGRSWRGFHHHACLVMLAYGSLVPDQRRVKEAPVQAGKKRRPTAQDHRPGDPPRLAAPAPADAAR